MPVPNGSLTQERAEIEFLKGSVDLAAIVRESGVELRRVGQQLMGRCPFHDDATPSLAVTDQLWNCLGCAAGGDVVSFLQLKEGLSFAQALERLRQKAGPTKLFSRPRPARDEAPPAEPFNRAEILERVVSVYSQRLPESRAARDYLNARGLASAELWQAFRLGFSDGSLPDVVPHDGGLRAALRAIGILNAHGREHFRGCVVVPLCHPEQGMVGLYGRRIASEGKLARHLYLPGPQRGVLNGPALKTSERVVIAESVLDALSLWVAGCRNVTCLYGVHGLPKDLAALLGTFAVREVCFCLDADRAGREATERLSTELRERGIRCWAAELPAGMDPNDVLVRQGPAALEEFVRQARPLQTAAPTPAGAAVQPTADGFEATFDDVAYRVTPLEPFGGRLQVKLAVSRADQTFFDRLDLYSHRSRLTLGRRLHGRFNLLPEEVERHLLVLLEAAERWVGVTVLI